MFFTTESFKLRDGHHTHFVIYVDDPVKATLVKNFIKEYFRHDRVDIEPYNPDEGGIFYITKEDLQGPDWDFWH